MTDKEALSDSFFSRRQINLGFGLFTQASINRSANIPRQALFIASKVIETDEISHTVLAQLGQAMTLYQNKVSILVDSARILHEEYQARIRATHSEEHARLKAVTINEKSMSNVITEVFIFAGFLSAHLSLEMIIALNTGDWSVLSEVAQRVGVSKKELDTNPFWLELVLKHYIHHA